MANVNKNDLLINATRDKTISSRFWKKVNKSENCWLWTASKEGGGYGQFSIFGRNGTRVKAHRFSYVSEIGEIPEGMEVCHSCDTPACVRPEHLFLGSHKENMIDAKKKGRMIHPPRWGENNNSAKLKDADIPVILRLLQEGESYPVIASKFGVSRHCIQKIVSRKNWRKTQCLI